MTLAGAIRLSIGVQTVERLAKLKDDLMLTIKRAPEYVPGLPVDKLLELHYPVRN